MKKFFPYILIVLIVAQMLMPFTVRSGIKNVPVVQSNKAEAAGEFHFLVTEQSGFQYYMTTAGYADINECNAARTDFSNANNNGSTIIGDCTNTPKDPAIVDSTTALGVGLTKNAPPSKDVSGLPACGLGIIEGRGTILGCVAQIFYYVLFVPSSYVFALTGIFFDFTFNYSIQDSSYSVPFVVEGWGIVRDFCNMFFIFVLLYIAFGTILNLHGVKTKEMIINVVIIGLFINFSLFATQLIVDTSNILARVFYNSDAIKITQGTNTANGVTNSTVKVGAFGEIPLSAAIVNKINPQNLIINGSNAVVISTKVDENTTISSNAKQGGDMGAGAFILITLLAVAVNVVGIITFLSVGLIFVARVIGLWMAMIFSPFVFFSYAVPGLRDMEMIGWKKWWPETIKMAFLAPIFIFFLYLIIAYLQKGLSIVAANVSTDGTTFVLSTVIPFIFIMILLLQAKKIAKSFSGQLGQSITNGIAAIGGIALGGAAIGTAALGRRVVGQTMAKASRGDTATQKYEKASQLRNMGDNSAMAKLSSWDKLKGRVGSVAGLGKIYGKDDLTMDIKTKKPVGVSTGIGGLLNKKQKSVGEVDHARHEIDEAKKSAGLEGVADNNLSGINEMKVREAFIKGKKGEIESDVKKGYDAKKDISLINSDGSKVEVGGQEIKGEEQYKKAMRSEVEKEYVNNPANNVLDKKIENLTDKDRKNIENQLNAQFNVVLKATIQKEAEDKYAHTREESRQKVGGIERAVSQANTGSYDVRNLANIKSDRREGFLTKVPVALIAGIATGVRAGMKNVGANNGPAKIEGNFMKDLGSVVSDSLKTAKISVDVSHVGEHKSSADSHGGGGHGH